MNVNYIAEINAMHIWEQTHPLSATEFKVWCKLMHLANQDYFPERMQVHNTLLCSLVGCGETTLASARNRLKQLGRLDYKGRQKHPAIYFINYFSCENPGYTPGGDGKQSNAHDEDRNLEKRGYNGGYDGGYNRGINGGYMRGLNGGTYINKTRLNETPREILDFGSNWRTSARARMAVAQEVLDVAYPPRDRARDGVCETTVGGDLHGLIDEYLREGLTPEVIVEVCEGVPVEQWSGRLWEALRRMEGERRDMGGREAGLLRCGSQ